MGMEHSMDSEPQNTGLRARRTTTKHECEKHQKRWREDWRPNHSMGSCTPRVPKCSWHLLPNLLQKGGGGQGDRLSAEDSTESRKHSILCHPHPEAILFHRI